jgi:nucleoside-diphosphate-sugar epimerase
MTNPDASECILVTGGGGFLGKAICRRLAADGHRVRSFSRRRHAALEALGVSQHCGDLADAEAVAEACRGASMVFHAAAKAGVWGPWKAYYRTNVTGTQNVLAACRQHGVDRLVYTSSPSVVFNGSDMEGVDESVPYPERYLAHYPATKAQAERRVLAAVREGLRAIILRPHLIWGPEDNHLVPRILQRADRLATIGDGRNRVDTVYIDNAADAHLLAADALRRRPDLSGHVYFISQDDPIPLWDMVNAILAAGGKPPLRRNIGVRTAKLAGALLESAYRWLPVKGEPPMTRFVAEELATAHWFDISAARRDLGYAPRVSTAEGLQRLSEWLRSQAAPGPTRPAAPSADTKF